MYNSSEERLEHFLIECENASFQISQEFQDWLWSNGFFSAPASTKYHGAYDGGLFDHCFTVYRRLHELTSKLGLKWQRPESPFIIGMFHDLCKCDQYLVTHRGALHTVDNDGDDIIARPPETIIEYNPNVLLKGHGDKSVMLLSQFMSLTEEEMLCIRYHMGAYEKDDWQGFDMAIRRYPNVLMAHTADMLASKVDNM